MDNRKAQTEILVLFLIIMLGIVWFIGYSIQNANPYNTFIKDCENINKNRFTNFNQTCYSVFDSNKSVGYSCNIINYDGLKEFCYNEFKDKTGEKENELG